jgi:uncharacterized protein (TIGR02266 family)
LDAEHTLLKTRAKRISTRVPTYIPVDYNFINKSNTGHILNISETGIFICSSKCLKPGDTPQLKFSLPGGDKIIDVQGAVIWVDKIKTGDSILDGMGIHFGSIAQEHKGLISSFVRKLDSVYI